MADTAAAHAPKPARGLLQAEPVKVGAARGTVSSPGGSELELLVGLQGMAGNRAVLQLLASDAPKDPQRPWTASVQRQNWAPDPSNPFARKSADPGKPAKDMTKSELEAALDEHEDMINASTASTPDVVRREKRRDELRAAYSKLMGQAATAKPARPKRGAKSVMPPRPGTLDKTFDLLKAGPADIRREMDLIVAYLAAGPSRQERKLLEGALGHLELITGDERQLQANQRRVERIQQALTPTKGDEADQLLAVLTRIQQAEPMREHEGVWLIYFDGQTVPVSTDELKQLREKLVIALRRAAIEANGVISQVEGAWQERTKKNKKHWVVHGLVKFATGAGDIPKRDIDQMVETGNGFVGRIGERAKAGRLYDAGYDLLILSNYTKYWAERVGEWEATLMRGAARWVIALTIAKEALSILAGFGAARLATLAGGGSFIGTLQAGAKIAGMTTGTGIAVGGIGSAATGRDLGKGIRAGGGAGFGVGANALTAGVGKIASIGDVSKATGFGQKAYTAGKAIALDAGTNVTTSVIQAGIEGGNIKQAATASLVSSPISTVGGGVVDKLAKTKAAATAGKTFVGGVAGGTGATAADSDALTGTLVGAGGGFHGGLASPAPDGGAGAGTSPKTSADAGGEARTAIDAASTTSAVAPPTGGTTGGAAPARPRGVPPPIPEAALRGKGGAGAKAGFSEAGPAEPDGGAKRPGTPDFEGEEATQPDAKPAGDFADEAATNPDADPEGARIGQTDDEAGAAPRATDEEEYGRPAELDDPDIEPEMKPPQDWDHQLVVQLKQSTSRFENFKVFLRTFNMDRSREVGLYRNTETGEYIVIQGEQRKVGMVPLAADLPQRWKKILEDHSKVGRWVLVAHTHPRGTPFPSGPKGDFNAIVREARLNRQSRQSEIYYPTIDGQLRKTTFGFDIDSDTPYWFKPDGVDQPYRFQKLEDYLAFVGVKEGVPMWFPRGKVDDAWFRVNQGSQQGEEEATSD